MEPDTERRDLTGSPKNGAAVTLMWFVVGLCKMGTGRKPGVREAGLGGLSCSPVGVVCRSFWERGRLTCSGRQSQIGLRLISLRQHHSDHRFPGPPAMVADGVVPERTATSRNLGQTQWNVCEGTEDTPRDQSPGLLQSARAFGLVQKGPREWRPATAKSNFLLHRLFCLYRTMEVE